jgi:hypothetical protein
MGRRLERVDGFCCPHHRKPDPLNPHISYLESETKDELVAQVSNLLYRRFPNRQGVETFGASAGLETRDTADWEVCATICV